MLFVKNNKKTWVRSPLHRSDEFAVSNQRANRKIHPDSVISAIIISRGKSFAEIVRRKSARAAKKKLRKSLGRMIELMPLSSVVAESKKLCTRRETRDIAVRLRDLFFKVRDFPMRSCVAERQPLRFFFFVVMRGEFTSAFSVFQCLLTSVLVFENHQR